MLCQVPRASRPPSTGHGGVRRHQRRHHVRATVAGRAVPVPPAVVGGEQVAQRREQVVVGARAGLDHRDPGGGVRHEQLQQAVALAGDEPGAVVGDVEHDLGCRRCGTRVSRTSSQLLLESRRARVTQAGGVVAPPDVAVDQLPGHPVLVAVEPDHLEGRGRRAGRRRAKTVARRPARSPALRSSPGSPSRNSSGVPLARAAVDGCREQRVPMPRPCCAAYDAQRAQQPDVDQLAPGVEPGVREPDVAHDLAVDLGDRLPRSRSDRLELGPGAGRRWSPSSANASRITPDPRRPRHAPGGRRSSPLTQVLLDALDLGGQLAVVPGSDVGLEHQARPGGSAPRRRRRPA